jgi:hypothetical protein
MKQQGKIMLLKSGDIKVGVNPNEQACLFIGKSTPLIGQTQFSD